MFDILATKKKFNAADVNFDGKYRYIARGEKNNGIRGYITEDIQYLNDANTISFGQDTATMFYQGEQYFTGDKIKVFSPKNHIKLNKNIAQLFIATMQKAFSTFSWGSSSYNVSVLSRIDIQLPIKNGEINFSFIEKFIAELEAERIAELEAYLIATNLKDYTLTIEEEKVLNDFENANWGIFKISEIFEKLNLKNHNKSFDKLHDTSTTKTTEFNLPLVNAKLGNNGIMFYGRENDFDSSEMTIDVISNGAVATGTVYTQPQKTGVLWDAYLLKATVQDITKKKLLFMATSLQKSIKTKFGWDNKAVWSKVQHETISFPTNDNQPDYQLMETFISAIQKLVIKDVVMYTDSKIATSKEVVNAK